MGEVKEEKRRVVDLEKEEFEDEDREVVRKYKDKKLDTMIRKSDMRIK